MNIEHFPNGLSPLEHAALMDAAKARALELRREAIRDFWSAVGLAIRSAGRAIRRRMPLHLHARWEA